MAKMKKHKTGPKPERIKLDGNWRDAMEKVLKKKRPAEGWPEPEKKGKKKGKKNKEIII